LLKLGTTSSSLIPEILKKLKFEQAQKKIKGGYLFISLIMNLFQKGAQVT